MDLTGKTFGRLKVLGFVKRKMREDRHVSWWHCRCECGKEIYTSGYYLTGGARTSCGCGRRGNNSHNWKGGRTMKYGYVFLNFPQHPNADRQGHVAEHVVVMSKKLNRPLGGGEVVHHKNGIRNDNRIDNLELCTRNSHFIGQRVSDRVKDSVEYLSQYAPHLLKNRGLDKE